jgi:hypothetical protein
MQPSSASLIESTSNFDMSDQELREIVREVVARRFGRDVQSPPDDKMWFRLHASHERLPLPRGGDMDGSCLIEPTVMCNHCGYCLSYGH